MENAISVKKKYQDVLDVKFSNNRLNVYYANQNISLFKEIAFLEKIFRVLKESIMIQILKTAKNVIRKYNTAHPAYLLMQKNRPIKVSIAAPVIMVCYLTTKVVSVCAGAMLLAQIFKPVFSPNAKIVQI
jgi:ubiquinone/menaquinone biosynthesis C-methylase UbiE